MRKYIPNSILRQVVFIILTALLTYVLVKNLVIFVPGALGALCMYALLLQPLKYMEIKWKLNRNLNVLLLLLASLLVIIGPIVLIINMLTKRISKLTQNTEDIQNQVDKVVNFIQNKYHIDLLNEKNFQDVGKIAINGLGTALDSSFSGIMQIGIAFLLVYFMLANYKKLEHTFYQLIPMKTENLKLFSKELKDLIISNAVGVPLVAIVQGVIAYIGYLIFGVDDSFGWFILTVFGAMVPVLGAALAYVPLGIIMIVNGQTPNAYFLLVYCFIVVGFSDNIVRFWLQKKMADIHPLITIFGVIIGVNLFGFIGIIFGPILFSLLFWMFKLYRLEFVQPEEIKEETNTET